MIHLIEALNFRCLKYIHQNLSSFQVLIGANATGKTTFLDVINIISDIVKLGVDEAITKRTSNFLDLTFLGEGDDIELAIELIIPEEIKAHLYDKDFHFIRYELKLGLTDETKEHAILEETAYLLKKNALKNRLSSERTLFPALYNGPDTILHQKYNPKSSRRLFGKKFGGNDNFYSETIEKMSGQWAPSFKFGFKKTALANLPADSSKFPVSNWLKEYLFEGIQSFILDSLNIRKPSPPGQKLQFLPDGSNLPWVIDDLKKKPKQFERWLEHIRTALPDIKDIDVIHRPEDKHKYIRIHYINGGKIPSWFVSDGTLRLLALTLPAYLPNLNGVFLIEEPENGIHPKAIETIYQSLSSVYNAQILMASHSPIVLSMVKPVEVLCFAKTPDGITDIVNGAEHPKLKNWRGTVNISDLFAGGILG